MICQYNSCSKFFLGKNENRVKIGIQVKLCSFFYPNMHASENPFWLPDTIYSLVLDVTLKISNCKHVAYSVVNNCGVS